MNNKSVRLYCKEAKHRMKSRFWQEYQQEVATSVKEHQDNEIYTSKVALYYQTKTAIKINGVKEEDEIFYLKVKDLLSKYGEVSDAIGRLTDKEYFKSLSYEQKQRYLLDLSNKYLKAKERYYKEIKFETIVE